MKKKIWEHADIDNVINECKGKKIILVGGCFDLIHYGHHTFLQKAKEQGDVLIVALEPDEHIQRKKNRQPVHRQRERAEILSALTYIDAIILLPYISDERGYKELVEKIHPFVIAISEGDPQKDKKQSQAVIIGATVKEVVPLMPRFATSSIIENY